MPIWLHTQHSKEEEGRNQKQRRNWDLEFSFLFLLFFFSDSHNGWPGLHTDGKTESDIDREENSVWSSAGLWKRIPWLRLPSSWPEKLDVRPQPWKGSPEQGCVTGDSWLGHQQDWNPVHLSPIRPMPILVHLPPARTRHPCHRHPCPGGSPCLSWNPPNVWYRCRPQRHQEVFLWDPIRDYNSGDQDGVWAWGSSRIWQVLGGSTRGVSDSPGWSCLWEDNCGLVAKESYLCVEAEEVTSAKARRAIVEWWVLEG